MESVIVFDNLVQPSNEIAGENRPVKGRRPSPAPEQFVQPNARGELYRPKSLEDIASRAHQSGEDFKRLFNLI